MAARPDSLKETCGVTFAVTLRSGDRIREGKHRYAGAKRKRQVFGIVCVMVPPFPIGNWLARVFYLA
jgi:hypothetical protein